MRDPGEAVPWQVEDLHVRGEAVHLVQRGTGPALLLVHGFPSNWLSWRLIMDRLADRYRLIAPDLVGFGRSTRRPRRPLDGDTYADRLADLLDDLDLERAYVAGLSWGGAVGQRLALRHPDRVQRLVLVASVSAARPLLLGDRDLMGLALGRLAPPLARLAVRRYVGDAADNGLDPAKLREIVDGYVDPLRLPGTLPFLRRFVRATASTPPVDVTRIAAPTLVITPAEDRIVAPAVGRELTAAIPGAQGVVIPGAGHAVQFQAAARLADLITGFLPH